MLTIKKQKELNIINEKIDVKNMVIDNANRVINDPKTPDAEFFKVLRDARNARIDKIILKKRAFEITKRSNQSVAA